MPLHHGRRNRRLDLQFQIRTRSQRFSQNCEHRRFQRVPGILMERFELHPLDRAEAGDEPVSLAHRLDRDGLAWHLALGVLDNGQQ